MANRCRVVVTCVVLVLVISVASAAHATGQTTQPTVRYPLPTFEEDWSRLRDAGQHDDRWDPVKFVPLSDNRRAFLSLGGEARATYERFDNQNFGHTAQDPNGYFLQRYVLHGDVHAGTRVRVWGEISSSLEQGRVGGPRPFLDENRVDLHQLFADLTVASRGPIAAMLRVGRQEIAIGSGRLYALREGPNVPFRFDGVRGHARRARWTADAWAARPVISRVGAFDDTSSPSFGVWGAYVSGTITSRLADSVDAYYLGVRRDAARFDQGVADERRHTLGARIVRRGTRSYDAEAMLQFGRFGTGSIRAWRVAVDAAQTLRRDRGAPRIGIALDAASGDRSRADPNLQTFNAMFQSGTYSGRAQLLGPYNSVRVEPSLALTPHRDVAIAVGWGFYWRQTDEDGLYGIPGQLIVPSNGGRDRYEGSRPIAQIDWQLTRHLSTHVNYIYVFNGPFEKASVHGTSTLSFFSPWIAYRF